MDALITLTKQGVDMEQVTAVIAKAKALGWTVEWRTYGVE